MVSDVNLHPYNMAIRQHLIPLPRGCLTIMEGNAADMLKHCIRGDDVNGKSASIILRSVHQKALDRAKQSAPSEEQLTVGMCNRL